MTAISRTRGLALIAGPGAMLAAAVAPSPAAMPQTAWIIAALTVWMALWWMTEAVPLTVTALLPFLVVPLAGIMTADAIAATYYSPILFLILGGAFIALAIERTGLHRRLALAILARSGTGARGLLAAFMIATAILSMAISNTSTALIMVPIAVAVLKAGGVRDGDTAGLAGALMLGIAFAASIGGLGTLVGSPTNAIAAGLIDKTLGVRIGFAQWAMVGVPLVTVAIPVAWAILLRVQRVTDDGFDARGAAAAIGTAGPWSIAERRLVPLLLVVVAGWTLLPIIADAAPAGAVTDGTIAIIGAVILFVLPDGTGRPMLLWREADRAPWGVILMFGGGLALAAAMGASGLATWLGTTLAPLGGWPPLALVLLIVALTVLVTEFASNVATASGIMPVLAALIAATGADPMLMALPVAMAASWGFMLPSGTGPNAIAWASGHIALSPMLRAGLTLDVIGVPLIVAVVWGVVLGVAALG